MYHLLLFLIIIIIIIIILAIFLNRPQGDPSHPIIVELKEAIIKMDNSFNQIDIRSSNSAKTVNKKIILLCLHNPETKESYKFNHILAVLLHEMAHYFSKSYGKHENDHNEEFMINYEKLVKRAIDVKIFDPTDPPPDNYCKIN